MLTNYACGNKMISIANTLDTFLGSIFTYYTNVLLLRSLLLVTDLWNAMIHNYNAKYFIYICGKSSILLKAINSATYNWYSNNEKSLC